MPNYAKAFTTQTNCGHNPNHHNYEKSVRILFWILAMLIGGVNAWISRFYINNDAIAYIEIGEAIKQFNWYDSANFTFSPLYGLLFAIFQSALQLNPFNEIIWAKVLNYLVFIATLAALEIFLRFLKHEHSSFINSGERPLPWITIQIFLYSIFLVTSLVSVRLRLINPDMLIFCLILLTMSVVMSIRENPAPHFKFIILGCLLGLGYLAKAFIFLIAPLFLIFAALYVGTWRKSMMRVALAICCFLLITGPLLTALYFKKGSFSYGEGGRHVYAKLIGGQGVPVNQVKILQNEPRVAVYDYGHICTRPYTFDVTYWTIGINPKYDHQAHFSLFLQNLVEIPGQSQWLTLVFLWALCHLFIGSFAIGRIFPISLQILFLFMALSGIFLFAMISMEPRYVAPFLFLGSAGLSLGIRQGKDRKIIWGLGTSEMATLALVVFLLGAVLACSIDEAGRGLSFQDGKPSHKNAYYDQIKVNDFLKSHGVVLGNHVAVVASPPIQWARMAGVKITGEIEDPDKFLNSSRADRLLFLDRLRNEGITAVIAKERKWRQLSNEGWLQVPGTESHWVFML